MRIVSAGDANRQFSRVLREVAQGEVFTVLSRGKPVATISPARSDDVQRQGARRNLLERLRQKEAIGARGWMREELYER
ncbi:MAG: type II toxin-antitoxin system prevent-host-death family antitoxin [Candidatus Accumulibacter sp.]|jgi:prevent-host-death family protein|nr:type II toxin-antitoxin system prevent-host-death family antitoxin [Candidatus Accumulibacter necessarius]